METQAEPTSVGQASLARLNELLADHPNLTVIRESTSITVEAADESGFDVRMLDDGREATLMTPGWHDHYDNSEEAAATFMWLLTPMTRIVLTYRGKHQTAWKMQWDEGGVWRTGSRGMILFAFLCWGPRSEKIFQNRHIEGVRPQ